MLAGVPHQGGATWAVLQYLLGFARLGHDVWFIEPVGADAMPSVSASLSGSTIAAYFEDVVRTCGLAEQAALVTNDRRTVGPTYRRLREAARTADVVVNISGTLTDPELLDGARVRVYLDLDPVFNQLWSEAEEPDRSFSGHSHFFTVGQSIGRPECSIPTGGLEWIPTLPPVVLEHWRPAEWTERDAFTTIANWRSYGAVEHAGIRYGQKVHSLRRFVDAPARTGERFVLALAIHPDERADRRALRDHGWRLVDPLAVAGTPSAYRRFIQGSVAEFGIAKSGYVDSGCGWFSDRSACYLAAGRPVVAQHTGFDRFLPTGEGLFSFDTMQDLQFAVEEVRAHYGRHRGSARAIAQEYLDSDIVLTRFLELALATPIRLDGVAAGSGR